MYPMPTTRDMLVPAEPDPRFPAVVKICGIHPDRPAPNSAQPSNVSGSQPDTTTVSMPTDDSNAP